jgi:hypothetical protein
MAPHKHDLKITGILLDQQYWINGKNGLNILLRIKIVLVVVCGIVQTKIAYMVMRNINVLSVVIIWVK